MLQGAVIEKLTGRSWETNIKDNIFLPLGMSQSNTSIEEMEKNPEAALGYQVQDSFKISRIRKWIITISMRCRRPEVLTAMYWICRTG